MTSNLEDQLSRSLHTAANQLEVEAPTLGELQHRSEQSNPVSAGFRPDGAWWRRPRVLAPLAVGVAALAAVVGVGMFRSSAPVSITTIDVATDSVTASETMDEQAELVDTPLTSVPVTAPARTQPTPRAEPTVGTAAAAAGEPGAEPAREPTVAPSPDGGGDHHIFLYGVYLVSASDAGWQQQVPAETDLTDHGPVVSLGSGEPLSTEFWEPAELCRLDPEVGSHSPSWNLGPYSPSPGSPLAISNLDFDPRPRGFIELAPEPAHVEAVRSVLQESGHAEHLTVAIEPRVLRFDIEGDGVDEVLVFAEGGERQGYSSAIGTYSVVILRRMVDGVVENRVLDARVATADGPLGSTNQQDLADRGFVPVFIPTHGVVDIVDVDGNGVLEIVIEEVYFESVRYLILGFGAPFGSHEYALSCGP